MTESSLRVVLIAICLISCTKSAPSPVAPATAPIDHPAQESAAVPSDEAASAEEAPPAEAASSEGPTGVPECDAYVQSYESCIEAMSGDAKSLAQKALDSNLAQLERLAATPEGQASMPGLCTTLMAQAQRTCER